MNFLLLCYFLLFTSGIKENIYSHGIPGQPALQLDHTERISNRIIEAYKYKYHMTQISTVFSGTADETDTCPN